MCSCLVDWCQKKLKNENILQIDWYQKKLKNEKVLQVDWCQKKLKNDGFTKTEERCHI